MAFSAKVGETFYLKDNPNSPSHLYVILTQPDNKGKVVVANFTSAKLGKQRHVLFTPRDDGRLFNKDTTVQYTDARLMDREILIKHVKDDPNKVGIDCPMDIVRGVVIGAFKAKQSPNKVLKELEKQYPDLYKKYYY